MFRALGEVGGGGDSHIKVTGVIVVPFRCCNLWLGTPYGVKIKNGFRQRYGSTLKGIELKNVRGSKCQSTVS